MSMCVCVCDRRTVGLVRLGAFGFGYERERERTRANNAQHEKCPISLSLSLYRGYCVALYNSFPMVGFPIVSQQKETQKSTPMHAAETDSHPPHRLVSQSVSQSIVSRSASIVSQSAIVSWNIVPSVLLHRLSLSLLFRAGKCFVGEFVKCDCCVVGDIQWLFRVPPHRSIDRSSDT